jgi:hypothetical protein
MALIVEDAAIPRGAETFRGARILVHRVADPLARAVDATEPREDYLLLMRRIFGAALVCARAPG